MKTKRLLAVTLMVCLGLWMVVMADDENVPAAPAAADARETAGTAAVTETDADRCESRSAEEIVQQVLERSDPIASPPDCPAEASNCNNGNNLLCPEGATCRLAGELESIDTGLDKCKQADGGVLNCHGGETVYVTIGDCSSCPCCSAPPPDRCLCPPCGQFVRVTCGAFGGSAGS